MNSLSLVFLVIAPVIYLRLGKIDENGMDEVFIPSPSQGAEQSDPTVDLSVFEVVRPPQTSLNGKHRRLKRKFFSCERSRAGWLCRSRYSEGCFEVEGMTPVPSIVLCLEESGPDLPSCGSGQSYFCSRENQ